MVEQRVDGCFVCAGKRKRKLGGAIDLDIGCGAGKREASAFTGEGELGGIDIVSSARFCQKVCSGDDQHAGVDVISGGGNRWNGGAGDSKGRTVLGGLIKGITAAATKNIRHLVSAHCKA